jgi:plastocyanin
MIRRLRILLATTGLLALTLGMAPAVAAGDPCYHGYTIPPTTSAETSTITLEPCAFVPTTARVAPGTTVTFQNGSEFAHLVFGANAAWGDRDVELVAGATRTVRFDQPGIYAYSCAIHRGMTGVIVVGEPDLSDVASAASTSTGGSDQGVILAVAGLVGFAVLGWVLAIIQRRRATAPAA